MITPAERFAIRLSERPDAETILSIYRSIVDEKFDAMLEDGWERVNVAPGDTYVDDGDMVRVVYWISGVAFALRKEVHAERQTKELADAVSAAQRASAPPVPGEALTSVLCPSCHATMAKQPVCPKCEKGQAGYKILCICTQCDHEVYL